MAFASVHAAFCAAVERWPQGAFMAVLPETAAAYGIVAGEMSFAEAAARVAVLAAAYRAAGYGPGHRVALLLENRPEFLLHWFALNGLGASIVPINPDLRAAELEYLLGHSEAVLAVAIAPRQDALRRAGRMPVIGPEAIPPAVAPVGGAGTGGDGKECALLYTSGTTGLPKGCVLSQEYFLMAGASYVGMGHLCALREGEDRMLTPLPLFHVNALAYSVVAMLLVGGCLIVLDRFHPRTWWDSVVAARASIVHCLGVMPAMLMSLPVAENERAHRLRYAFCPGPDRRLHALAEARFGIPLIDAWAMTETGGGAVISAHQAPRRVGESCFGRAEDFMRVRIVDPAGDEVQDGTPGELLVRHAGPDPRRGFFTAYLKDPVATEAAWIDGWFHTGDIVRREPDRNMFFVDREKNVIRRSGENISAIEVEGVLQQHPMVRAAAVAAVPDALRGDEVLACIVAEGAVASPVPAAGEIVAWCLERLAYYKAPGYVAFVEALPLTATNKVQRGVMKTLALALLDDPGCVDTRALKKRAT